MGTEDFLDFELGSVEECIGAADVLIAETAVPANRRRVANQVEHDLPVQKRQRLEVWGLMNEMTKGNARMAMAHQSSSLSDVKLGTLSVLSEWNEIYLHISMYKKFRWTMTRKRV